MSSLTSDELNFMVFRYLQESGFTHSAFVLGYEAGINKSKIDGNMVPISALIRFVQKGLQYLEMEANLSNESEEDIDEDFSFFQPLDLITKDVKELQDMVREKKREREKIKQEKERARKEIERQISSSDVIILKGHTSQVSACAWSPSVSRLASGSGDATVRIWSIPVGSINSGHLSRNIRSLVLNHAPSGTLRVKGIYLQLVHVMAKPESGLQMRELQNCDLRVVVNIITVHWVPYPWPGKLISTLRKHEGPIFCLKWNRRGDHLLTGGEDKTAVVWDVKAEKCKEQFRLHTGPVLDVDWRNNTSFATSSTDSKIYFCEFGDPRSARIFDGHEGEVNCVRWDPTLSLLASCSDDTTAKIWSIKQYRFVHDLREHTKEVYSIRWSPTGPGTNNPNKQLTLASASFDSSIKLWDVELGKRLCSFKGHRERVFSIAFSPNGEYIASGSLDKLIHIWSIREEKMVKTYTGNGDVYEVCWNKEGNKVAGCFSDNTVCVFDFRM